MADDEEFNTFFPRSNAPKPVPPPPRRAPAPTMKPTVNRTMEPQRPAAVAPVPVPVPVPLPAPPAPPEPAVAVAPEVETPGPLPPPVGPNGFKIIPAPRAADVTEGIPLDPAALELLTPEQTPRQFLDALVAADLLGDAIRYLAYILPRPAAIAWARHCVGEFDAKANQPALRSIDAWLNDGSEENRRAAQSAAQSAGLATPAGLTAQAVFWSGGSIAPAGAAVVAPAQHLTPQAVAMALGAVVLSGGNAAERSFEVLRRGVAIANRPASGN